MGHGSLPFGRNGEVHGTQGVCRERAREVLLAAVHVRHRGAVDDHVVGIMGTKPCVDRRHGRNVELRGTHVVDLRRVPCAVDRSDVGTASVDASPELAAQLSMRAGYQDAHLVLAPVAGNDTALGDHLEMPAIVALAIAFGAGEQTLARDPAVLEGNLLGNRYREVLGTLDRPDEL